MPNQQCQSTEGRISSYNQPQTTEKYENSEREKELVLLEFLFEFA